MKVSFTVCVVLLLAVTLAWAEEPVDLDMVTRIRDEGFNRSEVMESGALYEGDTLNQVWPTQEALPDQWWWHLAPEEALAH